jgi:hypothetical protein
MTASVVQWSEFLAADPEVPGSMPGATRFFWGVMGLEQGPLSLVTTIEELLGRKSSGCSLENQEYGCGDPLYWPHDTLYPKKLALTSPTSDGRSVSIVHSRTEAMEGFVKKENLKNAFTPYTLHNLKWKNFTRWYCTSLIQGTGKVRSV